MKKGPIQFLGSYMGELPARVKRKHFAVIKKEELQKDGSQVLWIYINPHSRPSQVGKSAERWFARNRPEGL